MDHAAVFPKTAGDELRRKMHGGSQCPVRLRGGAIAQDLVEAVWSKLADARLEAADRVVAAGGRRVSHGFLNHIHTVMPVAPAG